LVRRDDYCCICQQEIDVSIHSSLRASSAMARHRNVLTRIERLAKLEQENRWSEDSGSVTGLPKVRSIKVAVKKKKKAESEEADEAAPAAAAE